MADNIEEAMELIDTKTFNFALLSLKRRIFQFYSLTCYESTTVMKNWLLTEVNYAINA